MATKRAFCPNSGCAGVLTFETTGDDENEALATCPVCDTEWADWEIRRYGTWLKADSDELAVDESD